ncbi:cytochrome P450 [Paracrocinitomix mangrovi]|uniref:cytochrome P450 n=1 Tax=Paracrocinitomix mangrovi TaxID=2862509 RepID=UPI001C8E6C73|nr:cytochrome P450 [Paracrocinitomix mangrovi]UKN03747.1 cytochrome P450 [Paracrocinitomix mangrovi]
MNLNQVTMQLKDLPQPKGKWPLGNLAEFKEANKHRVIEKWSKECGDIFKISLAGKKFIVSVDPELNGKILKMRPEKFSRFNKINEVFQELGINGVFNAEGEDWYKHRKPAAEALNAKNVKLYYPIVAKNTIELLNHIERHQQNNINVSAMSMKYTIDITTEIAFGYALNTLNESGKNFQEKLEKIFPMINKRISAPFPYWRYFKSKKDKELEESLKSVETQINEFIEHAEKKLETQPTASNFLEALLIESKEDNFSTKEVFGNVFTMLLAGEDTTSNSISWAVFYLSQHPEWIAKIRTEANEIYGNNSVPETYEDLQKLSLANAVAQEAIRLKPTTPQLFMQANEDVLINDLAIEKGQVVMLQNMVAQTADNFFTDGENFHPERWLKAQCPYHEKHHPQYMRAFGAGPRFCPGMKLAMDELTMAISTVCKHYNFELTVPVESVIEKFAFTMQAENLIVRFTAN